jgi:hypothetical protein
LSTEIALALVCGPRRSCDSARSRTETEDFQVRRMRRASRFVNAERVLRIASGAPIGLSFLMRWD